jgi:hypothetical protein
MDQSGSMAESVVYGSVTGSIFASLPALSTRVVTFDTEVVDLTEQCSNDPVDMIFGVQLGGGTDINKAVAYCEKFIVDPTQTIFLLISDLIEGGNQSQLIRLMHDMVASGVRVTTLLALSDSGIPVFDETVAGKLSAGGDTLLRLYAKQITGIDRGCLEATGSQGTRSAVGNEEGKVESQLCLNRARSLKPFTSGIWRGWGRASSPWTLARPWGP